METKRSRRVINRNQNKRDKSGRLSFQTKYKIPGLSNVSQAKIQEDPENANKIIIIDETDRVISTYIFFLNEGEIQHFYSYHWHIECQGMNIYISDVIEEYPLQLWKIDDIVRPKKTPTMNINIFLEENGDIVSIDQFGQQGSQRCHSKELAVKNIHKQISETLELSIIEDLINLMLDPFKETPKMTIGNIIHQGYHEFKARLNTRKIGS
jgi:hypothetical protein